MMGQCLQLAQKAVEAYKDGDEKYTHLDTAEVEKVQKLINEKGDWYGRVVQELNGLPKTADPSTLASQFVQEKESFWHTVTPILNKPKPKVEPPKQEAAPAEAAKDGAEKAEDTGDANKKTEGSEDVVIPNVDKISDNMDVD